MKFCVVLVVVTIVFSVTVEPRAWKSSTKYQPYQSYQTNDQAFSQRLNNYERYKHHKLQKYRKHQAAQKRLACICIGKPVTSSPVPVTSIPESTIRVPSTAAATASPIQTEASSTTTASTTVTPSTTRTTTPPTTTTPSGPVTTLGPGKWIIWHFWIVPESGHGGNFTNHINQWMNEFIDRLNGESAFVSHLRQFQFYGYCQTSIERTM